MNGKVLQRLGLLNIEAPDLSDLMDEIKREAKAYCTSQRCAKNRLNGVQKRVPRTKETCPDCGHYLVWRF